MRWLKRSGGRPASPRGEGKRITNSRPRLEVLEDRRLLLCTVTSLLDDNGAGNTLRECIASESDGGIVRFGTLSGAINLDSSKGTLLVNKSLTIQDTTSPFDIAVSGGNQIRVFTLDDGTGTKSTITIAGLTIKEGKSAQGGGIHNKETLTINSSIITNNTSRPGPDPDATVTNRWSSVGGGIFNDGNLTINGSTITANYVKGDNVGPLPLFDFGGAGIYSIGGTIVIDQTTISFNTICDTAADCNPGILGGQLYAQGGGIASKGNGSLTIKSSTISSNEANLHNATENWGYRPHGGGVLTFSFDDAVPTLRIENSTISDNRAEVVNGNTPEEGNYGRDPEGGGIWAGGQTTIVNSTIAKNVSRNGAEGSFPVVLRGGGGGIWFKSQADHYVSWTTIAENRAETVRRPNDSWGGGGIGFEQSDNINLYTTIVATNVADDPDEDDPLFGPDINGEVMSDGYNLIGDGRGSEGLENDVNNDQVGGKNGDPVIDPLLADLASNEGPTPTMALQQGSPAIDHGNVQIDSETLCDQRGTGFARFYGGGTPALSDVGAYERQPTNPPPGCNSPLPPMPIPPLGRLDHAAFGMDGGQAHTQESHMRTARRPAATQDATVLRAPVLNEISDERNDAEYSILPLTGSRTTPPINVPSEMELGVLALELPHW